MATLDDIVNVSIGLQTTGVKRADFGTPMIVGPLTEFTERVRSYSNYNAAVSDGLPANILTALSDTFAQIPRPKTVKVGRRQVGLGTVAITVKNLTTYKITINGTAYTYTSDATATAAEIATGLDTAIGLLASVTVTVSGNNLTIAYTAPATPVTIKLGDNLAWSSITSYDAFADDMAAITFEDNAWYGLITAERSEAVILSAAEWTETQEKLYLCSAADADILLAATTDDTLSQLQDLRYYRTAFIYSASAATQYPDAAWMSYCLTFAPGSETWALKKLASVSPSNLIPSERNAVIAKGGNTFEYYQTNIALTNPGQVVAGEWIDTIRGRDWLKDVIQTNMVQMMINRAKIPYTDAGIQMCANNLRKSLQSGVNAGYIAPDEIDADGNTVPGFVIEAPLSQDVDSVTKASRVLTLNFTARLAGAVHVLNVTGAVSYEL